jgi:dienelactone hydrolase
MFRAAAPAALFLSGTLALQSPSVTPPSALVATVAAGRLPVGFHAQGSGATAMYFWYPAQRGGGVSMADYLGTERDDLAAALIKAGAPDADVRAFTSATTLAAAGAQGDRRMHALVLVAQGNGQSVADQAVLCELLASHGFVVATTPSPTRRQPMKSEDDIPRVASEQARDLARTIEPAVRFGALTTRIAVVGHSFGARAALLLAMRDRRITHVVSLDGGIGTATGTDAFRSADEFNAQAPLRILHFFERRDEFMKPDFALFDTLTSSRITTVELADMGHTHFTTLGFAAAAYPGIAAVTHAGPQVASSLRTMVDRTLAFLGK